MHGMRRLQQEGLVAQVGVSNYSLAGWKAAEAALGSMVLSNQVQYSLVHRRPELDLLAHAADARRALIAYSPLAQGFLSGRYRAGNAPGGVRATNPLFLPDNLERAAPLLDLLREVARAHDVQPAQVALAWLLRRPNVVVIPGARSVEQLEANAAAADLELSDEQDRALSRASDAFVPVSWPQALPRLARGWWDRRGRPGR
jgi:aryl-alcohol dehydrogenase-like predicted oxidoreductase